MSRGGHNWKGGGTVEGSRSLNVMKLARAGHLSDGSSGSWRWTYGDGTTASIQITGARDAVTLDYRIRSQREDWQSVRQRVPIRWTPCRFGGERPWFVCDVHANGVYCGRRVAKLYGAGRLFACRTLLSPRICDPARRADGPSSSSLATPASQARRGLRWARRNAARAPEVDAAANV